MKLAKKIRLFPTDEQAKKFFLFAGAARWAWNESLAFRKGRYEKDHLNTTVQDCQKHIQDLKHNHDEYAWLNTVPEAITKRSVRDLDRAYKGAFKSDKGFPRFKKKDRCKVSFYQRTDAFHQTDPSHVKITGIKAYVKIRSIQIPDHVTNITVSYDGKYWYLSYSYEVKEEETGNSDETIGVDLGVKNLAVVSDGRVYGNINRTKEVRRLERRKKHLQRQLSRKYEMNKTGTSFHKTSNIRKLEQKVRLINRRLKNIRNTYIHKVTKDLVRTKPGKIVIEDLNVKGMMKNRHLSKAIADEEFWKFRQYLTYKCELYGITLVMAERMYPSSKMCSCCKHIKKDLKLKEREYKCPACGMIMDRELNASINLMQYGCI